MDVESVDGFSLLPTLAGLVLLLGGRQVFVWAWPAIAFLAFMLPMPFFLETALSRPLRHVATVASTYVLQTIGFPAFAEGNIIHIDQIRLGVVDACSGLGMLVTFFALATAMALIVRAPLGDKIVLVLSAIPIAIIANVARITATAIAHTTLGTDAGNAVMHDLAGWLMMPLALGLMWLELRLLDRLFPPIPDKPLAPLNLNPFNPEQTARVRITSHTPSPLAPG
jgi:exosortase